MTKWRIKIMMIKISLIICIVALNCSIGLPKTYSSNIVHIGRTSIYTRFCFCLFVCYFWLLYFIRAEQFHHATKSIFLFIGMHMPWQEGGQSHVCILSISIVSPSSRIFLLYFGIILMLYFFSSVFYHYGSTVSEK